MAIGYGIYLAISPKKIFANGSGIVQPQSSKFFSGLNILLLLGLMGAGGTVLYNSPLLGGFASYTIAVKRVGVLLGVIWGWLFFKEKDLGKKLLGAAIAIAGVVAILWS
jgi:drug/metabolite transporter (DMT)-like permease